MVAACPAALALTASDVLMLLDGEILRANYAPLGMTVAITSCGHEPRLQGWEQGAR